MSKPFSALEEVRKKKKELRELESNPSAANEIENLKEQIKTISETEEYKQQSATVVQSFFRRITQRKKPVARTSDPVKAKALLSRYTFAELEQFFDLNADDLLSDIIGDGYIDPATGKPVSDGRNFSVEGEMGVVPVANFEGLRGFQKFHSSLRDAAFNLGENEVKVSFVRISNVKFSDKDKQGQNFNCIVTKSKEATTTSFISDKVFQEKVSQKADEEYEKALKALWKLNQIQEIAKRAGLGLDDLSKIKLMTTKPKESLKLGTGDDSDTESVNSDTEDNVETREQKDEPITLGLLLENSRKIFDKSNTPGAKKISKDDKIEFLQQLLDVELGGLIKYLNKEGKTSEADLLQESSELFNKQGKLYFDGAGNPTTKREFEQELSFLNEEEKNEAIALNKSFIDSNKEKFAEELSNLDDGVKAQARIYSAAAITDTIAKRINCNEVIDLKALQEKFVTERAETKSGTLYNSKNQDDQQKKYEALVTKTVKDSQLDGIHIEKSDDKIAGEVTTILFKGSEGDNIAYINVPGTNFYVQAVRLNGNGNDVIYNNGKADPKFKGERGDIVISKDTLFYVDDKSNKYIPVPIKSWNMVSDTPIRKALNSLNQFGMDEEFVKQRYDSLKIKAVSKQIVYKNGKPNVDAAGHVEHKTEMTTLFGGQTDTQTAYSFRNMAINKPVTTAAEVVASIALDPVVAVVGGAIKGAIKNTGSGLAGLTVRPAAGAVVGAVFGAGEYVVNTVGSVAEQALSPKTPTESKFPSPTFKALEAIRLGNISGRNNGGTSVAG